MSLITKSEQSYENRFQAYLANIILYNSVYQFDPRMPDGHMELTSSDDVIRLNVCVVLQVSCKDTKVTITTDVAIKLWHEYLFYIQSILLSNPIWITFIQFA